MADATLNNFGSSADAVSLPAARALTLTLKVAALLLLLVALIHAVVLWWAQGELQSSGFKNTSKILYSRLIVPEQPVATVAAPPPAAVTPAAKPKPVPKPRPETRAVTVPPKVAQTQPEPDEVTPTQKTEPEQTPKTETATPLPTDANADIKQDTGTANSNNASVMEKIGINDKGGESINPIDWPPSTRIGYRLGGYWRGELHGSGTMEWVRESLRTYQLSLKISSLVNIEYRSRGLMDANVLKPLRYEEQLPRGVTAVSFNHDTNKVSFSRITDIVEMAPDMQDRVSSIMQLVRALNTDPERLRDFNEKGERIKLNVANPTGTDVWEFEVKGSEEVRTEQANVQAWHLLRVPRKPNGDMGVELWLSPQIKGMPVRIKLATSADTFLDLIMIKAEQAQ